MILNVILDLVLVGILVVGMVIGLKNGFVKTIEKPLKSIFSLGFSITFSRIFAEWVVEPIISEPVFNRISGFLYDHCTNLSPEITVDELPTLIKLAASLSGVDLNVITGGSEDLLSSLVAKLTLPLVHIVATVISFLLLIVAARLLLMLVFVIVNKVCEVGALKVLNRVLGCIVCVFFAIFIAWGVVSIFGCIISLPSLAETEVIKSFTCGFIYNLFKQYNPIGLLLSF